MNLARQLDDHRKQHGPIGIGVIGCGKFATMFLAQVPHQPGFAVRSIIDLDPDRARTNLRRAGWNHDAIVATPIHRDSDRMFETDGIDVMIEATGDPIAGLLHASRAIDAGMHCIMVNVEADVLAGPALARRAAVKGLVYSQAYGDQPALIAELIDWARVAGFPVIAAGKGTKHMPAFHQGTPDDVWERYGIDQAQAAAAGMNPKMFNSFLDGTKSAIEMAAVANANGLVVPDDGLMFPPAGALDLAQVMADHPARCSGGIVEVVSCLNLDGTNVPDDLRWGVFVCFEAPGDYAQACFGEYGLTTDRSGRVSALYRPYHMIGLELGISVARACVQREPTGCSREMRGDVVATAKTNLNAGTLLDGEGGYTVYGRLQPVEASQAQRLLPIGLAQSIRLERPVAAGTMITLDDVALDPMAEIRDLRALSLDGGIEE